MTETLMMNLFLQLQKKSVKKRASYLSSTHESDIVFRKLLDKLEQAEILIKLVETEHLETQMF